MTGTRPLPGCIICPRCSTEKSCTEFHIDRSRATGRCRTCKACTREYNQGRRHRLNDLQRQRRGGNPGGLGKYKPRSLLRPQDDESFGDWQQRRVES